MLIKLHILYLMQVQFIHISISKMYTLIKSEHLFKTYYLPTSGIGAQWMKMGIKVSSSGQTHSDVRKKALKQCN